MPRQFTMTAEIYYLIFSCNQQQLIMTGIHQLRRLLI